MSNLPNYDVMFPGSAEQVSSEVMAHYFRNQSSRVDESFGKKLDDNSNMSESELLQRVDAVDAATVGRADMLRLYKKAPKWCQEALAYVLEDTDDRKVLLTVANEEEEKERRQKKPPPPRRTHTGDIVKVFEKLAEIKMLEKHDSYGYTGNMMAEAPQASANMFMVEKAGKTVEIDGIQKAVLRIITNAREANVKTTTSMPYNIFTLDALFQCVSNVAHASKKTGEWYCINADLRHWFHQIKLPKRLRKLFQFHTNKSIFTANTLPMGWYLSPPIAQAATWALILGGDVEGSGYDISFKSVHKCAEMPSWIPFRNSQGGIFVLQDNIFIISNNKSTVTIWSERLFARAKETNVEFKGSACPEVVTINRLVNENNSSFTEFTGINFYFKGWRTSDSKEKKLLLALPDLEGKFTYREIASAMGEIQWSLRVQEICPLLVLDFRELYKTNIPSENKFWGKPNCNISSAQIDTLRNYLDKARDPERKLVNIRPFWSMHGITAQTVMYAVDASMGSDRKLDAAEEAQIAIVRILSQDREQNKTWSKQISPHTYIGEAELEAIVWCIKEALTPRKNKPLPELIIIATDSMCAKGWMERQFAEREVAQKLLMEVMDLLRNKSTRVCCVYVRTDNNVADIPSRDKRKPNDGTYADWEGGKQEGFDVTPEEVRKRRIATTTLLEAARLEVPVAAEISGRFMVRRDRDMTESKLVKETDDQGIGKQSEDAAIAKQQTGEMLADKS